MTADLTVVALAVAAFAGTFLALEVILVDALGALRRRRHWSAARSWARPGPTADVLDEEEYLGVYGINWNLLRLLGATGGVLALTLVFTETTPQLALTGVAGALVPHLARGYLAGRARQRHRRAVRDFITALQLMAGMGETLSRALLRLCQGDDDSLFGRRLRHHTVTKLASSPEAVIEALAADFRSRDLQNLLLRQRASQRGGLSSGEALRATAEEIEAEMTEGAELAIEEAPTKLVLPMLVGLFPTILVLLLYPLAQTFLAGLRAGL